MLQEMNFVTGQKVLETFMAVNKALGTNVI